METCIECGRPTADRAPYAATRTHDWSAVTDDTPSVGRGRAICRPCFQEHYEGDEG